MSPELRLRPGLPAMPQVDVQQAVASRHQQERAVLDALAAVGGADAAVAAVAAAGSAPGADRPPRHGRRTPSADGSSVPGSLASPTSAGAAPPLHPDSKLSCSMDNGRLWAAESTRCITPVCSAAQCCFYMLPSH